MEQQISPCPLCGCACDLYPAFRTWVFCINEFCGYTWVSRDSDSEAIEAHNEHARKLAEEGE